MTWAGIRAVCMSPNPNEQAAIAGALLQQVID